MYRCYLKMVGKLVLWCKIHTRTNADAMGTWYFIIPHLKIYAHTTLTEKLISKLSGTKINTLTSRV